MFPKKKLDTNWIWTSGRGELRLNVMFGNDEIDDMTRKKVAKTGETGTFDVAPLIIDSFSAFVVGANNNPVPGVHPFRRIHPSDKTMTIRFECSSEVIAKEVMSRVIDGDYDVEFAFFFAGLNKVSTSIVSITSDSLKSVLSKATADGENTKATYIHKGQANKFISIYLANVRKIIYKEDPKSNTSSLTAGLEDQFVSLMHQVWSSSDLNPDRLTSELNKIFTYNQAETNYRNTSDKYYDFHEEYAKSLAVSAPFKSSASILGILSRSMDISASVNKAESGATGKTTHDVISLTDIKKYLDQKSIETEWKGEKVIPKSFQVYKLTDITDNLQVTLMAKELTAEKTNHAMIRTMSTLNLPRTFAGSHPPFPWLFCNGTAVSCIEYQRLFSVIGESFGARDGKTTFNVPDFRDRFPLGLNPIGSRVNGWTKGNKEHTLTINEMPTHRHSAGTLDTAYAGTHKHTVNYPGHNHGGFTANSNNDIMDRGNDGPQTVGRGGGGLYSFWRHHHGIPGGQTGITIGNDGTHSHSIEGSTAYEGGGKSFSIMPPYQTIAYIIFTGENCA
ncbi:unnamed protein product [Didymodactylos carnosus]|uniref:Phage tail collar domain-containing protein n=1 Tax=Didymodactylos carnosus TaxID=1234261 RepID=A0A814K6J2_9BILA|nr:unnamed protein product [Didymodactylos carnosus]CAF1046925.1 unnamed protein product [Didymodactylos carnosus]CAF3751427.1 unnamed protein product [Didymodactylos carnosus]CAF3816646.1 unnamed protein product [Didymodactylos carnosus]